MSSRIERGRATARASRADGQIATTRGGARRTRSASAFASVLLVVIAGCAPRDEAVVRITRDASAPEITTCTPTITVEQDMGLDLYIVLDRSGHLQSDWTWIQIGLGNVLPLQEFRGFNVGVAIYPKTRANQECIDTMCGTAPTCNCLRNCGCDDWTSMGQAACQCDWWWTSCEKTDYETPLAALAPLSDGVQLAKLANVDNQGDPALSPALLGSLHYRNQWERQNPGRHITQLLIAASGFDSCAENDGFEFEAAREILAGPDKPKTYIATYNESEPEYEELAMAGRTDGVTRMRSLRPPAPPEAPTPDLTNLFRKIRDAEGRCEYLLPEKVDVRSVNLASAADGTLYRRVDDVTGCVRNPLGWYYDSPVSGAPTRILTCSETCKSLHSATGQATANIQTGCPTATSDGGI